MTSPEAVAAAKQKKAAQIMGAYRQGREYRAWCPVHEADRIRRSVQAKRNSPEGGASLAILRDGENGLPRYKCMSQFCDEKDNAGFLRAVRRIVGPELVWTPVRGSLQTNPDEPDEHPLPDTQTLAIWTDNLCADATPYADDAAELLRLLSERYGATRELLREEGIGLRNWRVPIYDADGTQTGERSMGCWLTIPVFDAEGALVTVRHWDPRRMKSDRVRNWPGHGAPGLLGAHKVHGWPADEPVLFCEGEGDYVAATAARFHAVTGTGGAGNPPADLSVLAGHTAVPAYDNDHAGRNGGQKLAVLLDDHGAHVFVADVGTLLPERGADVRDVLLSPDLGPDAVRRLMATALNGEPWTPEAAQEATALADRVALERRNREARRAVDAEEALRGWELPPSALSLAEELAAERPEREQTVAELHYRGQNTVIIAGFKVGKTTLAMNLMKSLADKEDFLGHFPVLSPDGRVGWLNGELSEDNAIEWFRAKDVQNPDRIVTWHLRGHRLPLRTEEGTRALAAWCHERDVKVLIIDPFGAFYDGEENSNDNVRDWCQALDRVKRLGGVEDVFLIVHTGREQQSPGMERARGATRLDDWADSRWLYTQEKGRRYLRAHGRDVDVSEFALTYNALTRDLVRDFRGLDRRQASVQDGIAEVVRAIREVGPDERGLGPNATALKEHMGGNKERRLAQIEAAVNSGAVRVETRGKAKHYHANPTEKLRLSAKAGSSVGGEQK